jgi:diguanylate cyclase
LVKSTIDLAHSLGMQVTAEGIETPATLAALATMGCDVAQGYLIGKPMTEADFVQFFHNHAVQRTVEGTATANVAIAG